MKHDVKNPTDEESAIPFTDANMKHDVKNPTAEESAIPLTDANMKHDVRNPTAEESAISLTDANMKHDVKYPTAEESAIPLTDANMKHVVKNPTAEDSAILLTDANMKHDVRNPTAEESAISLTEANMKDDVKNPTAEESAIPLTEANMKHDVKNPTAEESAIPLTEANMKHVMRNPTAEESAISLTDANMKHDVKNPTAEEIAVALTDKNTKDDLRNSTAQSAIPLADTNVTHVAHLKTEESAIPLSHTNGEDVVRNPPVKSAIPSNDRNKKGVRNSPVKSAIPLNDRNKKGVSNLIAETAIPSRMNPITENSIPSTDKNAMDLVKNPFVNKSYVDSSVRAVFIPPISNSFTFLSNKNVSEITAKKTKSLIGDVDSNNDTSSHKTDTRNLYNNKDANPCAKEKEKVKPAFYFPDGSILKALLMSPLSFKNKIKNGIYQNGAYSTFPPETKVTTFVNVKSEPFDYDDQSNSISPTVLKKKFKSRRVESGCVATANIKKVNSFINKFGSELGTSKRVASPSVPVAMNIKAEPSSLDGPSQTSRDTPVNLANVTHLIKEEVDIECSRSPVYLDDSNECIPSLNVEVELEEGEGIINSHNIDYFYNGTSFGKDINNGEVRDINKQELMISANKLDMGLEDLRCEVCGRQFNFKKNMNKHLRHMHGLGRFQCAVCPLEFEKRRDLIQHRDSHSESGAAGGGFKCEVCGKIIQWYNHFIQHRKTHELGNVVMSDERRRHHICSICEKGFRSAANLRVHLRTHTGERPFVCNICGVSFAQKRIQLDHMNKHTGARPYECQDCGDKFSNYITYNVHKRTRHSTPNQPNAFACTLCDVSFIWRSNLVSHMRSHTKEKAYTCSICDKSFAHRNSLAYHRRVHAGVRPHACDVCGKCYRTSEHLSQHKATVHGPVECDICGKCFARRSLMRTHRRTHLGLEVHVCAECGRTFGSKSTLVRHARRQHPKQQT